MYSNSWGVILYDEYACCATLTSCSSTCTTNSFFKDWFHCFDAFIIVTSFTVDLVTHGVVEQIASLVIMLRLWRLVKMVEEMSVGASEQMEEIEAKVGKLEGENADLKSQIERLKNEDGEDEERRQSFGMGGRVAGIYGS